MNGNIEREKRYLTGTGKENFNTTLHILKTNGVSEEVIKNIEAHINNIHKEIDLILEII